MTNHDLDEIFHEFLDCVRGYVEANDVGKAKAKLLEWGKRERVEHLADLSRAVGIIEGLGFEDEYLDRRIAELTASIKDGGEK